MCLRFPSFAWAYHRGGSYRGAYAKRGRTSPSLIIERHGLSVHARREGFSGSRPCCALEACLSASYGGNECHALVDALIRGMVEKKRLHPRKVDSPLWGNFRNVLHMVIFYDLACRAGKWFVPPTDHRFVPNSPLVSCEHVSSAGSRRGTSISPATSSRTFCCGR